MYILSHLDCNIRVVTKLLFFENDAFFLLIISFSCSSTSHLSSRTDFMAIFALVDVEITMGVGALSSLKFLDIVVAND